MTIASRFPAVLDAILTTLRADSNLADVVISDGLPVSEDRFDALVMIGASGEPDDSMTGSINQEYHDLAGVSSTRDETVSIACAVLAQAGDVDVSAVRTRAFTVLGYVESAIRANYGLGLANVIRVEITDLTVYTDQFADGTAVRIPFTITATSII